jgi:nicotinamidase-related amidase
MQAPRHPRRQGQTALILIDVINDFDFPEGGLLLRYAGPAAERIAELRERAYAEEIPVIYVNDNFGRWRSDWRHQVRHCLENGCAEARKVVELLQPGEDDYFVLKPKHSGFYSTTLEVLLESLGVSRLILTGFAADICVLYTANDAYMRDFQLVVPGDCVAAETEEQAQFALRHMQRLHKAEVGASPGLKRLQVS